MHAIPSGIFLVEHSDYINESLEPNSLTSAPPPFSNLISRLPHPFHGMSFGNLESLLEPWMPVGNAKIWIGKSSPNVNIGIMMPVAGHRRKTKFDYFTNHVLSDDSQSPYYRNY